VSDPTDLNILNDAREKSQELIDVLFNPMIHGETKPRTYREKARVAYLKTAQKKSKTKKEIRLALGKQLRFLRSNVKHIYVSILLNTYKTV
jgi:transposase, IS5 family